MQSLDTQNSAERIKLLVEREGKAARNLVTWSVPVVDSVGSEKQHGSVAAGVGSHGNTSRYTNARRRDKRGKEFRRKDSRGNYLPLARQVTRESLNIPVEVDSQTPLSQREEICRYYSSQTQRQSRSSKSPSRLNLHARYWSYLFDNLHRAVDEIYKTCEVDESIVECQEVIMTLEVCRKDFEALIRRIQLFEQSDLHTKSSNIAWEVRKTTSPGKPRGMGSHQATPSPPPPSPLQASRPSVTPLTKSTTITTTMTTPPKTATPLTQSAAKPAATATTVISTVNKPLKLPQLQNISLEQPQDSKSSHHAHHHHLPASPTVSSSRSSSRPSSARSLDFGGGTKALKLQKKCGLEVHDASPTWADRVKGVGRTTGLAGAVRSQPASIEERKAEERDLSASTAATAGERKGTETSEPPATEEGWEMVTRGRVKSGSGAQAGKRSNWRNYSSSEEPTAKKPSAVAEEREEVEGGEEQGRMAEKGVEEAGKEGPVIQDVNVETQGDAAAVGVGEGLDGGAAMNKGEGLDSGGLTNKGVGLENGDDAVFEGEGLEDGATATEGEGLEGTPSASSIQEGSEENSEEATTLCQKEQQAAAKQSYESWTWDDALAAYNATEAYRAEKSWADRCDSPPGGLSEIPRSPGRAIHLHQRLSSPSRKRPMELEETRRIQEEKQAKAQLQRSKLQEEKTNKSRVEADKIREARESRDALARQRKEALEDKLQRAEMLRESHLQEIIRKAQEEEAKVSEISFINTLEAQNRKIEVEERYQGRKARLQELLEERQRKKDEQLAKEEAAQERRRTKEAERLAKVMELDQRRRDQEVKVEQMLLERDRAREEAAKEKAKERERKLLARNAALLTSSEELGRKIQLKHDESSRRYDQQLEQKKKLATGISSRHTSADQPPRVEAYKTKKWCTICSVEIVSEVYLLSHLRGRKHQAALALLSSPSPPLPPGPTPSTTDPLPPSPLLEREGGVAVDREGGVAVDDAVIVDASEEHQSPPGEHPEIQERILAGKKRARKLRQRMANRVKEMENKSGGVSAQSKNRSKLQKALRELNKQVDVSSGGGGGGSSGAKLSLIPSQIPLVDRALGDINRSLLTREDQLSFCQLGGVASVLKLLVLSVGGGESNVGVGAVVSVDQWKIPLKTFSLGLNVLQNCCTGQPANCRYLVVSNKAVPLVDLSLLVLGKALSWRRQLQQQRGMVGMAGVGPGEESQGKSSSSGGSSNICVTTLAGPLLKLLASMVSSLASAAAVNPEEGAVTSQVTDAISYMVSVGLVDRLGEYFLSVTGPIEDMSVTQLVLGGLNLLVATTAFLHSRVVDVFSGKPCEDPTLLTTLLQQTELVGLMQLLYAILLSGGPPRHSHSPPPLADHTLAIAMATIKALNNSAILDLKMVQACLGAEGISLEFRHIVSYLLWYCSHYEHTNLLHELILAVGYFCVLNHDNQVYLQSGRSPTLLQLLCGLPFEYFSNPKLSQLLYPTLIAACYEMEENRAILQEEISSKLLITFLEDACSKAEAKEKAALAAAPHLEKKKTLERKISSVVNFSCELQHRFPKAYWEKAITYFLQPS